MMKTHRNIIQISTRSVAWKRATLLVEIFMIFLYVFIIANQIEMRYIYRTKVLCKLYGLAKQNKPTSNKQNENDGNRNIQYFFVNS